MTKYKPGDKVKVRKGLILYEQYAMETDPDAWDYFTREMESFQGCTVTITGLFNDGQRIKYNIKEDGGKHYWTDEMLE